MITPVSDAPSDDVAAAETRRVGGRYLAQQILTCAPLVIVDLLLLIAVLVIARQTLLFIGVRIGLDLSDSFLPIAVASC